MYIVLKNIRGRKYYYWQRTYRVGKSVKTWNKYIGPQMDHVTKAVFNNLPKPHQDLRTRYQAGEITKIQYLEALAKPQETVPRDPQPSTNIEIDITQAAPIADKRAREAVMSNFDRYAGMSKDFRKLVKRYDDKQRREDERIQYGPLAARKRKQAAAMRRAKRNARGLKIVNPFLANMLKK